MTTAIINRTLLAINTILKFMAKGEEPTHAIHSMVSEEGYRPMTIEECDPIDAIIFRSGTDKSRFTQELQALKAELEGER